MRDYTLERVIAEPMALAQRWDLLRGPHELGARSVTEYTNNPLFRMLPFGQDAKDPWKLITIPNITYQQHPFEQPTGLSWTDTDGIVDYVAFRISDERSSFMAIWPIQPHVFGKGYLFSAHEHGLERSGNAQLIKVLEDPILDHRIIREIYPTIPRHEKRSLYNRDPSFVSP